MNTVIFQFFFFLYTSIMLLITAIIFKLHIYTIHFYIFFFYCPPDNILETYCIVTCHV